MNTTQLLEANIKVIGSASVTAYELAGKVFDELGKNDKSPEAKLIGSIGAYCAVVNAYYTYELRKRIEL